ncbi:MAG: DEAD/DEAH box helicase [Anaplasmataceae bacterium]|nr:DEAD/DEAH box helicase [Candidatus Heimdallarchaeota archaeon]MDH5796116.1 DEAD/DEAH box helicase [Anaplasmataceae bacterium]
MKLRPRQQIFVDRCLKALEQHRNTLGIAPTGAGKTIMLSYIIKELIERGKARKVLVIVHRNELLLQNKEKFEKVSNIPTSIFNANQKNVDGVVVFCTVQTLYRKLQKIDLRLLRDKSFKSESEYANCVKNNILFDVNFDFVIVDEAHHIVATSYLASLATLQEMSRFMLLGLTATSERSDDVSIMQVFSNIADTISVTEMIEAGYLVPSKTFVVDHENFYKLYELKRNKNNEYSERQVSKILDTPKINSLVVKKWQEKAENRKTVIFCSRCDHARNVVREFLKSDIKAFYVGGDLPNPERKRRLEEFQNGNVNVMVNVAILTEGFDYQPVSCIILLRLAAFKSTMIQMIGRGLRALDKSIYHDIEKKDCIVLDFGISTAMYGYINGEINQNIVLNDYGKFRSNTPQQEITEDKESERRDENELITYSFINIPDKMLCHFTYEGADIYAFSIFEHGGININFFVMSLDELTYYGVTKIDDEIKFTMSSTNKEKCIENMLSMINGTLKDEQKKKIIYTNKKVATPKQLQYIPKKYCIDYFRKNQFLASCFLSFYFMRGDLYRAVRDERIKHSGVQLMQFS